MLAIKLDYEKKMKSEIVRRMNFSIPYYTRTRKTLVCQNRPYY
jgi:hypothetical protein